MAFPLHAQLKHYDWGIPGEISKALHREPSGKPEAEIWWGNHPFAECSISTPKGSIDFSAWLRENNHSFPLLVKLLAAAKPLSIQLHPSREQAQRGFDREQAQGVPLDSPERTYKDRSAKPELLIALSDKFVGLSGFLHESDVRERLARWTKAGAPQEFISAMEKCVGNPREASNFVTQGIPDGSDVIRGLEEWLSLIDLAKVEKTTSGELQLLRKVAAAHPGDPGMLFVLVMHHVSLARGEALFVAPGEVHAYVEGVGLEVMLPSDNVIRAVLTSKHKDSGAFLELGNFSATVAPSIVSPVGDELASTYQGFGAGFLVHRMRFGSGELTVPEPSICFVESGQALVTGPEELTLKQGDTVFALAGERVTASSDNAVVWVIWPEMV